MAPSAREDELPSWVDRVAALAGKHGRIDHFEVRATAKRDRTLAVSGGKVTSSSSSTSQALGVHVFAGGGSAYVSTADLTDRRVLAMLDRGVALAVANGSRAWRAFPPRMVERRDAWRPTVRGHPDEASQDALAALASRAEAGALAVDPSLKVAAAFGSLSTRVWYADSAGSFVDKASLVSTLRVTAAAKDGARVADGQARQAGVRGLDDLDDPEALGAQAAKHAHESLRAEAFPAGRHRVLCDNHLSGMLAHESFGHLAEHDLVSTGWSTLRGRIGETLAAPTVSIADAPVVEHDPRQGVAIPIDDQGVRGRKVTMLDKGVLRSWMHTRDSAHAEGDEPTGNGRALDAQHPAIVRMRNTFFEPGDRSLEEAVEELRDGVYLLGARGGAPYSDGSFMFTSMRGYRVEKGEIGAPLRSMSIHGNVLDFLKSVVCLTRDFEVQTNYFGGCGKGDQSFLHVGVGGPHVLVEGALLGGQGA